MLRLRSGYFLVTSTETALARAAVEYAISCVSAHKIVRLLASADGSCTDLGVVAGLDLPEPAVPPRPVTAIRDALRALVIESRAVGRPVVVIVDGCDDADPDQLERVRGVLEWDPDVIGELRVILFGSQRLSETLEDHRVRALATRIGLRVFVPPASRGSGSGKRSRRAAIVRAGKMSAVATASLLIASLYGLAPGLRASASGDAKRVDRAQPAPAEPVLAAAPAASFPRLTAAPAVETSPKLPVGPLTPSATRARAATPPAASLPRVAAVPAAETSPTLLAVRRQPPSATPAAQPATAERPRTTASRKDHRTVAPGGLAGPVSPALSLVLQVGSFSSADNAVALMASLSKRYENVHVAHAEIDGRVVSRVRIGPFPESSRVAEIEADLLRLGHSPLRILTQSSPGRAMSGSNETVPSG